MYSDQAQIKKSVRAYFKIGVALFVFTAITVAVNRIHLAVPFAITVALIIAATKGSMVASVFMHLSHEKQAIYGALLLTLVFFVALLFLPVFADMDGIGTAGGAVGHAATAGAEHAGH